MGNPRKATFGGGYFWVVRPRFSNIDSRNQDFVDSFSDLHGSHCIPKNGLFTGEVPAAVKRGNGNPPKNGSFNGHCPIPRRFSPARFDYQGNDYQRVTQISNIIGYHDLLAIANYSHRCHQPLVWLNHSKPSPKSP